MFVCDECHKLAGYLPPKDKVPVTEAAPPECAGCGKTVNYRMWSLPRSNWIKLEVALALKEHEDGVG